MRTIAKWLFLCRFTATKINRFGFFRIKLYRCKRTSGMRTITEGLFFAFATRAPVVTFSSLHFSCIRCVTCAYRISHNISPQLLKQKTKLLYPFSWLKKIRVKLFFRTSCFGMPIIIPAHQGWQRHQNRFCATTAL